MINSWNPSIIPRMYIHNDCLDSHPSDMSIYSYVYMDRLELIFCPLCSDMMRSSHEPVNENKDENDEFLFLNFSEVKPKAQMRSSKIQNQNSPKKKHLQIFIMRLNKSSPQPQTPQSSIYE